jgi:hypothetical protein
MFKQVVFLKRRPGMTREEFRDYYENQHSKLHESVGEGESFMPTAQRYVRRYITPEKNPVTGEIHDCGFDCIMEIWWNSRQDFEDSMAHMGSPDILPHIVADETKIFASHANPVVSVEECDSPVGPYA